MTMASSVGHKGKSGDRSGHSHSVAYRQSSGTGVSFEQFRAFVSTTNPDKKGKILDRVAAKPRSMSDLLPLGTAMVEMAHSDPSNGESWLTRATTVLSRAVNLYESASDRVTSQSARARRILATMPQHYSVVLEGTLPDSQWSGAIYRDLGQTATATIIGSRLAIARTRGIETDTAVRERKLLHGELAEQAVHLLAHRASQQIGPQNWSPRVAFLSEQMHGLSGHPYERRSSDLTVQATYGNTLEDRYRLQVTAAESDGEKRVFADSITVVFVDPDLALEGEDRTTSEIIVREVLAEQNGLTTETERLNQRQDKLLDLMG